MDEPEKLSPADLKQWQDCASAIVAQRARDRAEADTEQERGPLRRPKKKPTRKRTRSMT
jgi:hypothetical protein